MNTERIINKLIEAGCPVQSAYRIASDLMQLDDSLVTALSQWINDNVETDMTIENFTLSKLKSKFKMSYPAALLTMDWLIKEPRIASEAIKKGVK